MAFVRGAGILVVLGIALSPSATAASPALVEPRTHDLHRLVERERAPHRLLQVLQQAVQARPLEPPPQNVFTSAVVSALDCEHARHDIQLDPATGVTTATLELRVRANGRPLATFGLVFDEGLEVTSVAASGRDASVVEERHAPARIGRITFTPALPPGETATVRIAYAGTLACGEYPESGGVVCTKGRDFSYFAHQSVFPYIFDPESPYGATLDGLTREIVLRVPHGIDVVATGEKISDIDRGDGINVSTWSIDKPLSRVLGMYVFAGKLGLSTVPGRAVPTTLVFPAPERSIDRRLLAWSGPVLDFVENMGGGPLPFRNNVSLVRLPSEIGDPGTATFGMTLLSETYARAGDLMHEETWAHENSHLYWGIVVPETDPLESRMMTEGLATLAQLDYTYAAHFQGQDRETYLARRFVPIGLDLASVAASLPAVQLAPGAPMPDSFRTQQYTLWAYYKSSATLDHLRVTVGEDTFRRALAEYARTCSYVGCRPDDFREHLERASGIDLVPFFSRWVLGTSRPTVVVSFTPSESGADIELAKGDDVPMHLELWLSLEDGGLVKRRVALGGRTTRAHVDVQGGVRSVFANPRHDVLVDTRSAVPGDLDFDGEMDGFDVLRCAPLVGQRYETAGAVGLWKIDERFDPRCDLDGDLDIDDDDMERLAAVFGTVRAR